MKMFNLRGNKAQYCETLTLCFSVILIYAYMRKGEVVEDFLEIKWFLSDFKTWTSRLSKLVAKATEEN